MDRAKTTSYFWKVSFELWSKARGWASLPLGIRQKTAALLSGQTKGNSRHFILAVSWLVFTAEIHAVEWVRASLTTNQPVWGVAGGLQFALPPFAFHWRSGPRGLIRLGSPILPNGQYSLINFIAIEPVVDGQRGLSELEPSSWDGAPGKRFWTEPEAGRVAEEFHPGKLTQLAGGVEKLSVTLRTEKFANGAHVYLTLTQRSDVPDEVQLTVHAEKDSAPMQFCILTATMGNYARVRQLWLKEKRVTSAELFPDYRGRNFTAHARFPLGQLHRNSSGDVWLAATTDEKNPLSTFPFPGTRRWYYGGEKVTQYWKKPAGQYHNNLEGIVNARYTYWQSERPIPGGISFENMEMREPFRSGQSFVFGITRKTPEEMGFVAKP